MTEKDKIIQDQRREITSLKERVAELEHLVNQYEVSMRTVIERLDAISEAIHKKFE